ncbi:MAG: DNA cytosine methyltransferase [Anaerolineaceae bacterium]
MTAEVIDLFCGIGGLTKGLNDAGLTVVAGFDNDKTCKYAYTHNNAAEFHLADIRGVKENEIRDLYSKNAIKILVGCAPCQPFSQLRSKLGKANLLDEKYNLLNEFGRIIELVRPDIISMENVPQLRKSNVYSSFISLITELGYSYDAKVINCAEYGISQGRRRFVLVGSLLGDIHLIPPTHLERPACVRDFIENLPPIKAGEVDENDRLHHASSLSDINVKRIQASKPGGTWEDWPTELRCECHRKKSGRTYTSVYGRMSWGLIGPTITTQFYSYGTGRFGHPEQDRALSLREGALLQTFPPDYNFLDPSVPFSFKDVARHIGNAVPVKLGEIIGESILKHLNDFNLLT